MGTNPARMERAISCTEADEIGNNRTTGACVYSDSTSDAIRCTSAKMGVQSLMTLSLAPLLIFGNNIMMVFANTGESVDVARFG